LSHLPHNALRFTGGATTLSQGGKSVLRRTTGEKRHGSTRGKKRSAMWRYCQCTLPSKGGIGGREKRVRPRFNPIPWLLLGKRGQPQTIGDGVGEGNRAVMKRQQTMGFGAERGGFKEPFLPKGPLKTTDKVWRRFLGDEKS